MGVRAGPPAFASERGHQDMYRIDTVMPNSVCGAEAGAYRLQAYSSTRRTTAGSRVWVSLPKQARCDPGPTPGSFGFVQPWQAGVAGTGLNVGGRHRVDGSGNYKV